MSKKIDYLAYLEELVKLGETQPLTEEDDLVDEAGKNRSGEESSSLDDELETGILKETAGRGDKKSVYCKSCSIFGIWIQEGTFPNGTKKWVDEKGLICNGRQCGACQQKRAKGVMRSVRSERLSEDD